LKPARTALYTGVGIEIPTVLGFFDKCKLSSSFTTFQI
jgi:hypothetical protein